MPWQQNGLSTQTSSRGNWVGKIYIHGGYDRTMCRWGGEYDSREGTGISHLRSLLCDSTMKSRWNRHQQITNLHDYHLGIYWMYHIANSIQTIDGIGIVPSLTQNNLRDVVLFCTNLEKNWNARKLDPYTRSNNILLRYIIFHVFWGYIWSSLVLTFVFTLSTIVWNHGVSWINEVHKLYLYQ